MIKKFKLRDNVPDTYVKRSRDFQLMCDIFDIMNNGVKFDIDTITSLSDTSRCRDSMLSYLQHKLGLHMDTYVTDETLRPILKCFPYIVKKKGSRVGIIQAICLFLYVMHCNGGYEVSINNINDTADMAGNYIIDVAVEESLPDVDVLMNILKYVIPTGYKVNYLFYLSSDVDITNAKNSDEINIILVNEDMGSRVRKSLVEQELPHAIGGLGTTVIRVSPSNEEIAVSPDSNTFKVSTFEEMSIKEETST
jgi:hypothetical protein